jgi:hypothetical protein
MFSLFRANFPDKISVMAINFFQVIDFYNGWPLANQKGGAVKDCLSIIDQSGAIPPLARISVIVSG